MFIRSFHVHIHKWHCTGHYLLMLTQICMYIGFLSFLKENAPQHRTVMDMNKRKGIQLSGYASFKSIASVEATALSPIEAYMN